MLCLGTGRMEFFSEKTKHIEQKFIKLLRTSYNYEEALKHRSLTQDDVDRFREKAKQSKFVPRFIVDKQLLLFLNTFPDDMDKSLRVLETFYIMRQTVPELFANRDLRSREFQSSLDHQDYVPLPVTADDYGVILHRLSSFNPRHWVYNDAVKTFITVCEAYAYNHGPLSGVIFIFDMRGGTFSHLFRPSLSSMRKGTKFVQEGCPFDIQAIHILNAPPFIDIIIGLVKTLARSDFYNKFHFHSTNLDYEKFYSEWVPKSHLPSDYGGDLESVEILHKRNRESLMKLRNYFMMEEQQWNLEFDQYVDEFGEEAFRKAGYF